MKQQFLNTVKTLIEAQKEIAKDAFPSIYSKSDVISLLIDLSDRIVSEIEVIEEDTQTEADGNVVEFFDKLKNNYERYLQRIDFPSHVNLSSAEFCLNGNEIELDSVDVDNDDIESACIEELENAFEKTMAEINRAKQSNTEETVNN